MDSVFNSINPTISADQFQIIEIGRSKRYKYYKTRRNGVLHFVKTPLDEFLSDLVTSEALRKEFLLGYGLNHPGIVRYMAFEDQRLYEEFVDGITLREMIDNNHPSLFSKDFINRISLEMLETLSYMHSQGIVHLDLKPENVMVTRIGERIKIIDLSCAGSATQDSTQGYTEGYVAPEQLSGNINITTDLYQVGKIIEELSEASGKRRKWRNFIEKATANHPDNRFKNAEEAIRAIPVSKKNIYKWLNILIGILILGALISVVINRGEPSYDNILTTKDSEDIPASEVSNPSVVSETSPTQEVDQEILTEYALEKKLSRMIDQKLDELYAEKVMPMYERMLRDSAYRNRKSTEFIKTYTAALNQLIAYGDELSRQYPSQKSYINNCVRQTFEIKTSQLLQRLYPRQ